MAWSSGACINNHNTSIPDMNMLLQRDDTLTKESTLINGPAVLHQQACAYPLLTFFPFEGLGSVDNMGTDSTASASRNMMQAMGSTKRPLFWPFLDIERMQGISFTTDDIIEHSGRSSEYYNMSNRVRMLRSSENTNEEVEMNEGESSMRTRKKKRLTEDQVRALEGSFEADKKLEAERKQKLAQRLCLEPRQVAIWFQNRRARSKTKHLEDDFALLQLQYQTMVAETDKLRSEVSRLTAELEASSKGELAGTVNRTKSESCQRGQKENKSSAPLEGSGLEYRDGTENVNDGGESVEMDGHAGRKMQGSVGKEEGWILMNGSTASSSCCSELLQQADNSGVVVVVDGGSSHASCSIHEHLGLTAAAETHHDYCTAPRFKHLMDSSSSSLTHPLNRPPPTSPPPPPTASTNSLMQLASHHYYFSRDHDCFLFPQPPLISNHVAFGNSHLDIFESLEVVPWK